MTIYALLKDVGNGYDSFHGMTSIQEAAETWDNASQDNWSYVISSDDFPGRPLHLASDTPIRRVT